MGDRASGAAFSRRDLPTATGWSSSTSTARFCPRAGWLATRSSRALETAFGWRATSGAPEPRASSTSRGRPIPRSCGSWCSRTSDGSGSTPASPGRWGSTSRSSSAGSLPGRSSPSPASRRCWGVSRQETNVTLGLLTGNLEAGARLKLAPPDYNRYFPFGAFGSDSADRYELPTSRGRPGARAHRPRASRASRSSSSATRSTTWRAAARWASAPSGSRPGSRASSGSRPRSPTRFSRTSPTPSVRWRRSSDEASFGRRAPGRSPRRAAPRRRRLRRRRHSRRRREPARRRRTTARLPETTGSSSRSTCAPPGRSWRFWPRPSFSPAAAKQLETLPAVRARDHRLQPPPGDLRAGPRCRVRRAGADVGLRLPPNPRRPCALAGAARDDLRARGGADEARVGSRPGADSAGSAALRDASVLSDVRPGEPGGPHCAARRGWSRVGRRDRSVARSGGQRGLRAGRADQAPLASDGRRGLPAEPGRSTARSARRGRSRTRHWASSSRSFGSWPRRGRWRSTTSTRTSFRSPSG